MGLEDVVSTACELVSEGFITSVYKRHSSTTASGFRMGPRVRSASRHYLAGENCYGRRIRFLLNITSSNGEEIIYSGSADASAVPSNLEFLHLGKWQMSLPPHINVEIPDPNLYFKYTRPLLCLTYISFRGVSVMKELPKFITHSRYLRILDLKACHHLEVLPSNIGSLWSRLVQLDMSECYFLDHMPASLSQLTSLRVLKGFFVGETNNKESCTLQDLSSMECLFKLNIYTSLETFPSEKHLEILQGFKQMRNLTICWGACPPTDKVRESRIREWALHDRDPIVQVKQFLFNLEKLHLRGAPEVGTRNWLRPLNFEKLEKLYIRGGNLYNLRHKNEAQKDKQSASVEEKVWSVKILRLRHLSRLQLHWSEVQDSFPNVVTMEIVDCPNLTSFPCDDSGLWTKDTKQSPADGSERHGISSHQKGPVECEDTGVIILE